MPLAVVVTSIPPSIPHRALLRGRGRQGAAPYARRPRALREAALALRARRRDRGRRRRGAGAPHPGARVRLPARQPRPRTAPRRSRGGWRSGARRAGRLLRDRRRVRDGASGADFIAESDADAHPHAPAAAPPPMPLPPPLASSRPPPSPFPRDADGRAGPCLGIGISAATGSRASTSRMKLRNDTTRSCRCTWRPATSSAAAFAARRTCSSVPSRMMSDRAASTASRMRRARSLPDSGIGTPLAGAVSGARLAEGSVFSPLCRFRSRKCVGSTARLPVTSHRASCTPRSAYAAAR